MTDRRTFIGSVAGGLLGSPAITLAQQPAKVPRIGILGNSEGLAWDGFRQGLRDLGYVESRNLTIEWRWVEGHVDRYPALAKELVQLKLDLIVTSTTAAALAAKQATSSIPIVMALSAYPERLGLVDSLAHPGGNITGLSNIAPELAGKRLQILKEMVPKVSRVAQLWNPAIPLEVIVFKEARASAAVVGVEMESVEVRSPEDYPAAFAAVVASRANAMIASGNPLNFRNAQLIVDFALKNRLPSIYEVSLFVEAGGLMYYDRTLIDLYRRAAGYVDKVLKGAKPGEMPIQLPTTFELAINSKTAKALGLNVPNSLLLRADQVIQ